jgi:hypothetical protein
VPAADDDDLFHGQEAGDRKWEIGEVTTKSP